MLIFYSVQSHDDDAMIIVSCPVTSTTTDGRQVHSIALSDLPAILAHLHQRIALSQWLCPLLQRKGEVHRRVRGFNCQTQWL